MKKRQNGCQNVIFEVMSEVQKASEDVYAGIGQFLKNPIDKKVCPEFDVKVGEVNFDLDR
jgi:hypothetical protein